MSEIIWTAVISVLCLVGAVAAAVFYSSNLPLTVALSTGGVGFAILALTENR